MMIIRACLLWKGVPHPTTTPCPGDAGRAWRTAVSDFDAVYGEWVQFHNAVVRHLRVHETPVVIDDGVTGLCISGFRGTIGDPTGGIYLIVDPHVTVPGTQLREIRVEDLYTRAPMMMAVVA